MVSLFQPTGVVMSSVACLLEVDGYDVKRKFEFRSDTGSITLFELRQAVSKCSVVGGVVGSGDATFKV